MFACLKKKSNFMKIHFEKCICFHVFWSLFICLFIWNQFKQLGFTVKNQNTYFYCTKKTNYISKDSSVQFLVLYTIELNHYDVWEFNWLWVRLALEILKYKLLLWYHMALHNWTWFLNSLSQYQGWIRIHNIAAWYIKT